MKETVLFDAVYALHNSFGTGYWLLLNAIHFSSTCVPAWQQTVIVVAVEAAVIVIHSMLWRPVYAGQRTWFNTDWVIACESITQLILTFFLIYNTCDRHLLIPFALLSFVSNVAIGGSPVAAYGVAVIAQCVALAWTITDGIAAAGYTVKQSECSSRDAYVALLSAAVLHAQPTALAAIDVYFETEAIIIAVAYHAGLVAFTAYLKPWIPILLSGQKSLMQLGGMNTRAVATLVAQNSIVLVSAAVDICKTKQVLELFAAQNARAEILPVLSIVVVSLSALLMNFSYLTTLWIQLAAACIVFCI